MDRRDFLTARRSKKPVVAAQSRNISSGLNPYSGPWTENEIIHLLKRTMFGARKADVDYFRTRSVSQAVDELLNPVAPQWLQNARLRTAEPALKRCRLR